MSSRYYQAAAAGAALIAAVTLAACGTGASPGTPASSAPNAPAFAAATLAAFNTADITFTTGTLGLEQQAAALAATVTGHTATPQLQQFAAGVQAQAGDAQRMRELMGAWHQPVPAPYSPGASLPAGMMGAGMMNAAGWAEISHEHGPSFNSHWLNAMISGYDAEIALCQQELSSGASPQARALAGTMLAQRQSELAQLQQWQHDGPQMGMMG
jgi:uncharacterized protein (DUF305 family)